MTVADYLTAFVCVCERERETAGGGLDGSGLSGKPPLTLIPTEGKVSLSCFDGEPVRSY